MVCHGTAFRETLHLARYGHPFLFPVNEGESDAETRNRPQVMIAGC